MLAFISSKPLATIERPRPFPSFLDETNGLKIFGNISAAIPLPKSIISICNGKEVCWPDLEKDLRLLELYVVLILTFPCVL